MTNKIRKNFFIFVSFLGLFGGILPLGEVEQASKNFLVHRQTAAHNARWFRIFMFIFCPAAENEPKERAEGTEVPSGSLLLGRRAGAAALA
ncbi:MAG: hypothetical protein II207_00500 [Clostridia bacterium]|nr:hypothetical protein [Clostridia bacterium]